MVEGAPNDIFEQGRLDNILIRNVNQMAKLARFMDAVTQRVVGNKSLTTPFTAFVKKQVDKVVQEIRFERTLEHDMSKQGIQYTPPRLQLHFPKSEPRLLTLPEWSMSNDSDDENTYTRRMRDSKSRKIAVKARTPLHIRVVKVEITQVRRTYHRLMR